jgi:hypothetical protein
MTAIINGSSPTVTFSDGTTQSTSAIVSGYVPYANLPAGSVVQVIYGATATEAGASTSTFLDTNLTATITPKSATNKIAVFVAHNGCYTPASATGLQVIILRNSTNIGQIAVYAAYGSSNGNLDIGTIAGDVLDSPATTSAITYKTQFAKIGAAGYVYINNAGARSSIMLMEIVA